MMMSFTNIIRVGGGFAVADTSALAAINRALQVCRTCSRYPGYFVKEHYLFRHTLLGLGMAVFALALLSTAACLSTGPEEAPFLAKSDAAMNRMMAAIKLKPSNHVHRAQLTMIVPHP